VIIISLNIHDTATLAFDLQSVPKTYWQTRPNQVLLDWGLGLAFLTQTGPVM